MKMSSLVALCQLTRLDFVDCLLCSLSVVHQLQQAKCRGIVCRAQVISKIMSTVDHCGTGRQRCGQQPTTPEHTLSPCHGPALLPTPVPSTKTALGSHQSRKLRAQVLHYRTEAVDLKRNRKALEPPKPNGVYYICLDHRLHRLHLTHYE